VAFLVVEKDVRACGGKYRRFFVGADKVRFVSGRSPSAKRMDDPLMSRRISGCN
jgi:hypothetical protein